MVYKVFSTHQVLGRQREEKFLAGLETLCQVPHLLTRMGRRPRPAGLHLTCSHTKDRQFR
jgi:hypothetical protein